MNLNAEQLKHNIYKKKKVYTLEMKILIRICEVTKKIKIIIIYE